MGDHGPAPRQARSRGVVTPKAHRPVTRYGWGWRERRLEPGSRKWVLQKRVSIKVDFDVMPGGLDEWIAALLALRDEHDLDEATLDTDIEFGSYGDRDRDVVYLTGWHDATDQEISMAEKAITARLERQRLSEEEQVKLLRRTRPELFT